jgi:hypothetical protein
MSAIREVRAVRAIADACIGNHGPDDRLHERPRVEKVLVAADVEAADAKAIAENAPRFWLYRELVQNNVRGVTRQLMPRATALMDARVPGFVNTLVADFLSGPGMRSHYMRDIPFELLAWAKDRITKDERLPWHTATLAEWELYWFKLHTTERTQKAEQLVDVAPHLPLVLESPAIVQSFACNIHEWEDPDPEPTREAVTLLGYRDEKNEPQLLVLTPLAADIVRELQKGSALAHAIPNACKSQSIDLSQQVLTDSAKLLADLSAAGIILGARA